MDRAFMEAVESPEAGPQDIGSLSLPDSYRAAVLFKDEQHIFDGIPLRDRDPAKSLHITQVPTPEPGPGEVLVATMASSVNYNTVWSAIFEPAPTFAYLERYARTGGLAARHDRSYHVIGSDLAGVVLRTGAGVRRWRPGQRVVAHCLSVELEDPEGHNDSML